MCTYLRTRCSASPLQCSGRAYLMPPSFGSFGLVQQVLVTPAQLGQPSQVYMPDEHHRTPPLVWCSTCRAVVFDLLWPRSFPLNYGERERTNYFAVHTHVLVHVQHTYYLGRTVIVDAVCQPTRGILSSKACLQIALQTARGEGAVNRSHTALGLHSVRTVRTHVHAGTEQLHAMYYLHNVLQKFNNCRYYNITLLQKYVHTFINIHVCTYTLLYVLASSTQ